MFSVITQDEPKYVSSCENANLALKFL